MNSTRQETEPIAPLCESDGFTALSMIESSKESTPMFTSVFRELSDIPLPGFTGTRIMMMPIVIGDLASIPGHLSHWHEALDALFQTSEAGKHTRDIGYLTIDEKTVGRGSTHRRAGMHVDGVYRGQSGLWGGGRNGPWAGISTGMITVSSHAGCRAWNQDFDGLPGDEGECDHLAEQASGQACSVFQPGRAYWVDGMCVHESMPMITDTDRQFVRLSLPSTAPWFEGYTENPLGVQPTGSILPKRSFMNA